MSTSERHADLPLKFATLAVKMASIRIEMEAFQKNRFFTQLAASNNDGTALRRVIEGIDPCRTAPLSLIFSLFSSVCVHRPHQIELIKRDIMDILFLLNPNFSDSARDGEGKRYYCPDCAFLEGVLVYCPELREQLEIRYVDYPRPRKGIVELVGEANQGCPNLVLDPSNHPLVDPNQFHRYGNHLHSDDPKVIVDYLATRYGVQIAHF